MNTKTSARRICHMLFAVVLPVLLGQCQPVPKPFAAAHKGVFSTIQIGPRAGTVVIPIAGAAGQDVGNKLAAAMARALRQREMTATTSRGHRGSHRLRGEAALGPDGLLRLTWRLQSAAGVESLSVTQEEVVAPEAWQRGDEALLDRLAANGADAIDQRLRRLERDQGRRIALAPVAMGPMDGVPEQGSGLLVGAMRAALAAAGVPLTGEPSDDGFVLLGSMHMAPRTDAGSAGRRRIEIVWHLIRPDGQEFGQVSQANDVPVSQLSGDWKGLARAIAQAGAPGVLDLLRRDTGG